MHNSNPKPVSVRPVRGILRGKIHRMVAVWPAVTQALSSLPDEQRLCDLQEVTSPGAALCLVRPDKLHVARSVAAARFRRGSGSGSDHAQTCALLPGACGQVYRVLVIATRAHAAATTHILRSVRRPSLAPA